MSKMAVKQWTCPNCLKRKKQVIELQLFNLNFREAMYMCMEKDCVFPLSDGYVIHNYIVPNVLLDIGDSDLSDSEDDDDNNSIDTNMKAEITSVSKLGLKGITPENVLIPETFGSKKDGMDECQLVSHTLGGFDTTPTSCDNDPVQRQYADNLHKKGEESSNKDMGSAAVISKYDCVLEDFEIPLDDVKNTGFSSFDYERVFTNLLSELSAYAESTCEPESKGNEISQRSEAGIDGKNKDTNQISNAYKSESEIAEEKNKNTIQVSCNPKSECAVTKERNKSDASQVSCNPKSECAVTKERNKSDASQVSKIYKLECPITEERNKNNACKISDTCKSKCGITEKKTTNACEVSNGPKGSNDAKAILISCLTKNDLSNCRQVSPSSDIEISTTFKPPSRSKLQAETVICPIKECDSVEEHLTVSDEVQDSKKHTFHRPYDSDLQSSSKTNPLNLILQLEDAGVQSCAKKRKLPLEDSATEFASTSLLPRHSVRVKKTKCLENFYYY